MVGQVRFREPVSGFTHLFGAILGLVGLIFLVIVTAGQPSRLIVSVIYSLTMIATFMASTVMHLYVGAPQTIQWLNRLDHSAIYLMIAGTYTPLLTVYMTGTVMVTLLTIVWTLAFGGVIYKLVFWHSKLWISVAYYLAMGWLALPAAPLLFPSLNGMEIFLIVSGGITYSVGAVIFYLQRPNLNEWWGHHEIWHLFVLGGAALHFAAVTLCVMS